MFSVYAAQAQPELNSFKITQVGQTVKAYVKQVDVSPGNAGANQLWDFSDITFEGNPTLSKVVNPSSTPYASSFPTATHAETSDNVNYAYYKMTDKEQTLLGQHSSSTQGSATVVYSNPLTIAKLPLAYNGTTSDDYTANYVASGIPMTLSGSVSTTYDGYGTLKTQYGTYNNVVRLKATKTDNSEFSGVTTIIRSVSYAYYVPGYTTSLFAITEITTSMKMAGMDEMEMGTVTAAYLYDPSFLTSNRNAYLQDLKLSVSPNPASDVISVDFKDLSSDHYTIRITEQDGSTVLENNIFASKGESHSIDISDLKSGLYFLEVYSSNGKSVKKIVKM